MKRLMCCCFVYFWVLLSVNSVFSAKDYSWTYKWNCQYTGRCIRYHIDKLDPGLKYYDNQNMCRLVCGDHGSLWPKPTGTTILGKEIMQFNPNHIKFHTVNIPESNEIKKYINEVTMIFLRGIMKECRQNCTLPSETDVLIKLNVNTDVESLTWITDESYSLDILSEDSHVFVVIKSETIFGARHGLETLSQLITAKNDPNQSSSNGLVILSQAQIQDNPVFRHRGFMLDTARNFIPIRAIKRMLDGMASTKLNIFHWHITDSQSFPLEMVRVPQITRYGAYSSKHIYKQSEIKNLIQYARYRGIRVILELDAPSHSGNGWQWGPLAGLGDLAVCVNQQPWRKYCIEPPCGQLNPANPNLYRVLRDVYADIVNIIAPGEILHMGGDEVFFGCWNATEEIVDLLISRGHGREVEDFLQLWAEYQSTSLKLWDEEVNKASNRPNDNPTILWSSHLTDPSVIEKYLPKERYIVQTWVESDIDLAAQLLKKGYTVIISTKNAWYFDHGFWGRTSYYPWRTVYNNKIIRNPGVLGGEACVWTEFIDEHSLDSRTWPRLAAFAERLWSDPNTNTQEAEPRLYRHRERLIVKGIQPEAITPRWCLQNEGECY